MTAEEELLVFQEKQKRLQQRAKEDDTRKLRSKLAAGACAVFAVAVSVVGLNVMVV